jgi:hypothetical protein
MVENGEYVPGLDDLGPIVEPKAAIPPEDNHNAVIVAVFNAGIHRSPISGRENRVLFLMFELDSVIPSGPMAGKRFRTCRRANASLDPKSTLYGILTAVFGDRLPWITTRDGARSIDPGALIGRPCMVAIRHVVRNGKTYADVASVGRHAKGLPVLKPQGDVAMPKWIADLAARRLDRPATGTAQPPSRLEADEPSPDWAAGGERAEVEEG